MVTAPHNNRENLCLKMPGYLSVFYISRLEKKTTFGNVFLSANNTLRGEEGIRREGMSQSIIFPILANLTRFFFIAVNIPH